MAPRPAFSRALAHKGTSRRKPTHEPRVWVWDDTVRSRIREPSALSASLPVRAPRKAAHADIPPFVPAVAWQALGRAVIFVIRHRCGSQSLTLKIIQRERGDGGAECRRCMQAWAWSHGHITLAIGKLVGRGTGEPHKALQARAWPPDMDGTRHSRRRTSILAPFHPLHRLICFQPAGHAELLALLRPQADAAGPTHACQNPGLTAG